MVRSSSRSAASSAATTASVSSGSSRTPSGWPPGFGTEPSAASHHARSAAGSTCTVPRGPNVLTSDRSSQSAAATSARVVPATRSASDTSAADITWACAPAIAAAASGSDPSGAVEPVPGQPPGVDLGPRRHVASTLRTRSSLTGYAVPSCWAHSETRSSSSIQRTRRSRSPGGRPSGSAATWWR